MQVTKTEFPVYTLILPSTKKTYNYRPFTAKEYKLLQMCKEEILSEKEGSEESALTTIIHIIKNCLNVTDKEIERFALVDLIYTFIRLRSVSVSNSVALSYECNNTLENKTKCKHNFLVNMSLDDIEVTFEDENKTIDLDNGNFVRLRYPSHKALRDYLKNENDVDAYFSLLADCIDYRYTETERFPFEDAKAKKDFTEKMAVAPFKVLETFLKKQPYVVKETTVKCKKCQFEHHIALSTFIDFFE